LQLGIPEPKAPGLNVHGSHVLRLEMTATIHAATPDPDDRSSPFLQQHLDAIADTQFSAAATP
jgi:hypothetical protein